MHANTMTCQCDHAHHSRRNVQAFYRVIIPRVTRVTQISLESLKRMRPLSFRQPSRSCCTTRRTRPSTAWSSTCRSYLLFGVSGSRPAPAVCRLFTDGSVLLQWPWVLPHAPPRVCKIRNRVHVHTLANLCSTAHKQHALARTRGAETNRLPLVVTSEKNATPARTRRTAFTCPTGPV